MISRVRLRNWKCHEDTVLVFRPGTNVLVGSMGSGKSSIIDAITFALFGSLPGIRSHRMRTDDLIMSRPARRLEAEVEVTFDHHGAEYTVKRVLERGKGTAYCELRKDGKLIEADKPTPVTARVVELLGMDIDLFLNAVYAAQNGIDEFLTLGKGQRMDRLDELLGIKRLEDARSLLVKVITRVQDRARDGKAHIAELERSLAAVDTDVLKKEVAVLAKEVDSLEADGEKLSEREAAARAELEKLDELAKRHEELGRVQAMFEGKEGQLAEQERTLAEEAGDLAGRPKDELESLRHETVDIIALMEQDRARLADLGEERGRLEGRASQLRSRGKELVERLGDKKKKAPSSEELEQAVTEMSEALRHERARGEDVRVNLAALREERKALALRATELREKATRAEALRQDVRDLGAEGDVGIVEGRLKGVKEETRHLRDQTGMLKARIQNLDQAASELETAGDACPVCDNPLAEDRKETLVAEKRRKSAHVRKNATKLGQRLDEREREERRLERTLERVRTMHRDLEALGATEDELSALEVRIAATEKEELILKEDAARFEPLLAEHEKRLAEAVERRDRERERERTRDELERAEKELADAKASLTKVKKEMAGVQDRFSEETLTDARARLDRARTAMRHAELAAELAEVQGKLEAKRKERAALHYSPDDHASVRETMGGLRAESEGLRRELVAKGDLLHEKRGQYAQAEANRATLDGQKERLVRLDAGSEDLTRIKGALSDTQTIMRQQIVEEINGVLYPMWKTLYPYDDLGDIRLRIGEEGRVKGDYTLEFQDSTDSWITVDGIASGGERSVACLALRVAFSRVLAPNLSWLVFDEPTHNLDRRGVEELAETLRDRLPDLFDQVIIISHEEQMENAITGACYRISRDKAEDMPARVEEV
ncbi:MAG: SMC family ATPase [Candidatus Undinarchaeales archaeon]|nr:SMC family ATPase [Candidatus Undinarchaeales archaeon]MDP7494474.1 SMC family ATPase [Candidatus Undinarchaeales archaeon]